MTDAERAAALKLARDVLSGKPPSGPPTKFFENKLPCFITLHTKTGRLRGCIGCVATESTLWENIAHFALAAAHEDPRFDPVEYEEVPQLTIEISVLGKQDPVVWDLFEIGRHGLRVRHGRVQGLLLAQVPVELGWTKEEFIKQTCIKAGLNPKAWEEYEWFYFEQTTFSE